MDALRALLWTGRSRRSTTEPKNWANPGVICLTPHLKPWKTAWSVEQGPAPCHTVGLA